MKDLFDVLFSIVGVAGVRVLTIRVSSSIDERDESESFIGFGSFSSLNFSTDSFSKSWKLHTDIAEVYRKIAVKTLTKISIFKRNVMI